MKKNITAIEYENIFWRNRMIVLGNKSLIIFLYTFDEVEKTYGVERSKPKERKTVS